MSAQRGRRVNLSTGILAVALVIAACAPNSSPVDSTPLALEPTPSSSTILSSVPETDVPSSTSVERIEPVVGTAPVELSNPDFPAVYLEYSSTLRDPGNEPPVGLEIQLEACSVAGPGVIVYEVLIGGEDIEYPFSSSVLATILIGDTGTGGFGIGTFTSPGRHLIVLSRGGFVDEALRADGSPIYEPDNDRSEAGRTPDWAAQGSGCMLQFGSEGVVSSERLVELTQRSQEIEANAPGRTVEQLAQQAFSAGPDAELYPLAVAYGEGIRFYAERWFVPDSPAELVNIDEHLDPAGCLEVEFSYSGYTVIQSRGCPVTDKGPLFQAGSAWFAVSGDDVWTVTVRAEDQDTALSVSSSLTPYWHLLNRQVPVAPVDETELARAPYQGGEVLVTFGEQKCGSSCQSPETWFFVYLITLDGLEPLADYPAWNRCMLAEEDTFVLGIAPRFGRIEVVGDGALVLEGDGNWALQTVFREKDGAEFSIEIFDEDGSQPPCVQQLAGDGRGGMTSESTEVTTTPPASDRVVELVECAGKPRHYDDFSAEEPLRSACVQTELGKIWLMQIVPSEMITDGEQGLECLADYFQSGSSISCFIAESPLPHVLMSGGDEIRWLAAIVPEGTTSVVAITSRGTEITGLPFDGLVLLWWLPSEGELIEARAQTASGEVAIPLES